VLPAFDSEALQTRLTRLDHTQRLAFGASCCERLFEPPLVSALNNALCVFLGAVDSADLPSPPQELYGWSLENTWLRSL
jgi:predicted ATPase